MEAKRATQQTDCSVDSDALADYPALFVEHVERSIRAALVRVQRDPGPLLAEETHTRARHILTYAFRLPAVWPLTCQLLLALAPKLEQAGFRREWLPYLARGLALSERCNDILTAAEIRLHMGHLHRLQGQFARAWTLLTASADAFAGLGEPLGQTRALNQLAYVAWQQHRYDEAEAHARIAMALLDEAALERAMSLSALGLVAIERQRWPEAEAYHRAALQLRMQHGDRRQAAWSLQNVGYALRGQGQYEAAIACYEKAIAELTELGDLANCAIVQMNLGIVYSLQEESNKALEVYYTAESTFRRIGDEWYLAKVLINQGIEFVTLCEWQYAEDALVFSATLFQQLADLSEYLNARYELGVCYLEQYFYDKALSIFESVAAQLSKIEGTSYHLLLTKVIDVQLDRARVGKRGLSNEKSPKLED